MLKLRLTAKAMTGRVVLPEVKASREWWEPGTEGTLKRTPEPRAEQQAK